MAVQGVSMSADWTIRQHLAYVTRGGWAFTGAYVNALVFTCLVVALLVLLCHRFRESRPLLAMISLGFVPIYGVMNIVAYGSQVTLAPRFAEQALAPRDLRRYFARCSTSSQYGHPASQHVTASSSSQCSSVEKKNIMLTFGHLLKYRVG